MDMKEIEKAVSEVMHVPIEAMHTRTRKREVVWARQLTWKYAKSTMPKKSLAVIGGHFTRDHATALHGIRRVNDLLETDTELKEIWTNVLNRLPMYTNFDDYIIRLKGKLSEEQLRQFCNCCVQI